MMIREDKNETTRRNGPTACCEGGECAKQDEWYSQCKPAKNKGTVERLCIFDFDDTIKIGAGRRISVGRDVTEIVEKCRELGYGVAIASASCETEFQKAFLRDAVDDTIFSADMLSSDAYQSCQPNKTPALRKVLDHFEMGDVPECAVFFDDQDLNGKFSAEVEVPFVKVDPKFGVTWNDFWFGMSLLEKNCPQQTEL